MGARSAQGPSCTALRRYLCLSARPAGQPSWAVMFFPPADNRSRKLLGGASASATATATASGEAREHRGREAGSPPWLER